MRTFDRSGHRGCLPFLAMAGLIIGSSLLLVSLAHILLPLTVLFGFGFASIFVPGHQNNPNQHVYKSVFFSLLGTAAFIALFTFFASGEKDGQWFKDFTLYFVSGALAYWLCYFLNGRRPLKGALISISRWLDRIINRFGK